MFVHCCVIFAPDTPPVRYIHVNINDIDYIHIILIHVQIYKIIEIVNSIRTEYLDNNKILAINIMDFELGFKT